MSASSVATVSETQPEIKLVPPVSVNADVDKLYSEKKWRMYVQELDRILETNKISFVNSFLIEKKEPPEECKKAIKALLFVLDTTHEVMSTMKNAIAFSNKRNFRKYIEWFGFIGATALASFIAPPAGIAVGLSGGVYLGLKGDPKDAFKSAIDCIKKAETHLNKNEVFEYTWAFFNSNSKLSDLYQIAKEYDILPENMKELALKEIVKHVY
jgi:hypothetical protein